MKGVIAKLALVLVSTLLVLAVAEQVLRAVGFEYRPMTINIEKPNDARLVHVFQDEHFVYDPELIWRPRPSSEVFNAQGFRGPELEAEAAPGVTRIFAIGDSNTLGWAGSDGANWPLLLGERLDAQGVPVELVNAGVWGYSSFQGLQRLREVLAYSPDVVLVSFGSNDAHIVSRSDREFARGSLFRRSWQRKLLDFRLGQLVAAAWNQWTTSGAETHRVDLERYRANLAEMAALCRQAGARMVLLTRPYIGPVRSPTWWKAFATEYNVATLESGAAESVPVIDVYSFFKEEADLFNDESHFTEEGHELAAEIIAADLLPLAGKAGSTASLPASDSGH